MDNLPIVSYRLRHDESLKSSNGNVCTKEEYCKFIGLMLRAQEFHALRHCLVRQINSEEKFQTVGQL
jgi:hypothetical protein